MERHYVVSNQLYFIRIIIRVSFSKQSFLEFSVSHTFGNEQIFVCFHQYGCVCEVT